MAANLTDYKQLMLDIAKVAGEAFDVAEAGGMDAVVDFAMAMRLANIGAKLEEARAFVFVHSVIRMRALGMDVRRMPGYAEGVKRYMGLDVVGEA